MKEQRSDRGETSCAAIRKLAYEFLDEELPGPESTRVAEHLSVCSPCAGHYAFERAFLAAIQRGCSIEEAPPELRARLRAALDEQKKTRHEE